MENYEVARVGEVGIAVAQQSTPVLRGCWVHDARGVGISLGVDCGGELVDCRAESIASPGVLVPPGSRAEVTTSDRRRRAQVGPRSGPASARQPPRQPNMRRQIDRFQIRPTNLSTYRLWLAAVVGLDSPGIQSVFSRNPVDDRIVTGSPFVVATVDCVIDIGRPYRPSTRLLHGTGTATAVPEWRFTVCVPEPSRKSTDVDQAPRLRLTRKLQGAS